MCVLIFCYTVWVESEYGVRLGFEKKGGGGVRFYKKALVYIGSLLIEYIDVDEVVGFSSLRSLDPVIMKHIHTVVRRDPSKSPLCSPSPYTSGQTQHH